MSEFPFETLGSSADNKPANQPSLSPEGNAQIAASSQEPSMSSPKKSHKTPIIMITVLTVIVLLSGSVGYYLYTQDQAKKAAVQKQLEDKRAQKIAAQKAYEAKNIIAVETLLESEDDMMNERSDRLFNRRSSLVASEADAGPTVVEGVADEL